MPSYVYYCPDCNNQELVVKPMADAARAENCPVCGVEMTKDVAANMPRVHADSYRRPIHSDALAIHPSQVEEHQRLYPDVPLDSECRPILSNYKQHEKYMEGRGVYKRPGRNRRKATKVSQ